MKRSTDRILTTHVGSLPRPPELIAMVRAKLRGEAVDPQAYSRVLKESVAGIVKKQAALDIDVIDDGEFGKPSFVSYGNERLCGFSQRKGGGGVSPWAQSREAKTFPEFYQAQMGSVSSQHARLVPQGDVMVLEDLGSTNGTYLNGEPLRGPQPLHHGDRIKIGDSEFSFER